MYDEAINQQEDFLSYLTDNYKTSDPEEEGEEPTQEGAEEPVITQDQDDEDFNGEDFLQQLLSGNVDGYPMGNYAAPFYQSYGTIDFKSINNKREAKYGGPITSTATSDNTSIDKPNSLLAKLITKELYKQPRNFMTAYVAHNKEKLQKRGIDTKRSVDIIQHIPIVSDDSIGGDAGRFSPAIFGDGKIKITTRNPTNDVLVHELTHASGLDRINDKNNTSFIKSMTANRNFNNNRNDKTMRDYVNNGKEFAPRINQTNYLLNSRPDNIKGSDIDIFNKSNESQLNYSNNIIDPNNNQGYKDKLNESILNKNKFYFADEERPELTKIGKNLLNNYTSKPKSKLTYEQWKAKLPKNLRTTDTTTYNLRGAFEGGLQPELTEDGTYHLGSRNPITGELLKSQNHPTWDKLVQGENEAGYEIYQKNGKYYSRPKK